MKARDYQKEAVDLLWHGLHEEQGNPLGVSPTGTGKTFMMNSLAKRLMRKYPTLRIMSVTHDATIIEQNADDMRAFWKGCNIGIYSAGLRMRDTRQRIIYAGIQSIHRRAKEFGMVSILFIDEAHMLSPNDGTMYQRFISNMLEINPKMRIVMLSATPYRLGQGHLLEGEIADFIAFDFTETEKFMWFVEQGYLSRLVTKKAVKEIDITDCAVRGGEFNDRELQKLSNTQENNKALVEECMKFGLDRDHWLVFASGVEHGAAIAEQFEAHGIPAIMLHSKSENRDEEREAWERGEYRALVNVGLFTTGYDFKPLDLIAVARATQSTSLWVQMCGRGTRPVYVDGFDLETKEGRLDAIAAGPKQNCLVLDFAGNTRRLGAINCPVIPKPRKKGDANEGEAPVKVCPQCDTYNHTRAARCEHCGFEFPPPKEITTKAGTDDVMVEGEMEPKIEELGVLSVTFKKGKSRASRNEYFRVSYTTFNGTFAQYFHPGSRHAVPRERFEKWWWWCLPNKKGKAENYDYPTTIHDAVERASEELRVPTIIRVDFHTTLNDVIGVDFDETDDTHDNEPF